MSLAQKVAVEKRAARLFAFGGTLLAVAVGVAVTTGLYWYFGHRIVDWAWHATFVVAGITAFFNLTPMVWFVTRKLLQRSGSPSGDMSPVAFSLMSALVVDIPFGVHVFALSGWHRISAKTSEGNVLLAAWILSGLAIPFFLLFGAIYDLVAAMLVIDLLRSPDSRDCSVGHAKAAPNPPDGSDSGRAGEGDASGDE